jgi:hypothetical protein
MLGLDLLHISKNFLNLKLLQPENINFLEGILINFDSPFQQRVDILHEIGLEAVFVTDADVFETFFQLVGTLEHVLHVVPRRRRRAHQ